jgi:hypothetical protein
MAATPKTPPGQKRLSEVSRHLILPSGIVTTGWPAVHDKLQRMGIGFDAWQQGLGRAILAKREDGMYAAGIGGVVISIARQVGKTYTIGALVFALCLIFPRLKVIWTAHHSNTADETFEAMAEMAQRPLIAPHIRAVRRVNGKQLILFRNRSRIEFGAREHGFGRGKQKVGILVLDEGQILSEKAMENLVPTTNQADNPLILMMGTPPRPSDPGAVFRALRREALSGESDDVLYVEMSASSAVDVSTWKPGHIDWHAVAEANPSFPHRTPKAAIMRMRKMLPSAQSFRYEGLGIWDSDEPGSRAISAELWAARGVTEKPEGTRSYGVAFSMDGSRVALAGAVKHDGGVHVELIDAQSGQVESGIRELADWLAERWRESAQIVIVGAAGGDLMQALRDRKVPELVLRKMTTPDYFTACSMLLNGLQDESVTHLDSEGQTVLDDSVAVCDKKQRGGSWGWTATTSDGDETPIEAISAALHAARTAKRDPNRKQRMVARR